jgi:hypothetical protein
MIRGFKDKRTEALYRSHKAKGDPPDIVERAKEVGRRQRGEFD